MHVNLSTTFKSSALALFVTGALSLPLSAEVLSHQDGSHAHHVSKQPHGKRHERGQEHRLARMAHHLELSAEQQDKIAAVFSGAKAQRQSHQASLAAYRQQLDGLVGADVFDEQAFLQMRASYQLTFDQLAVIKAKTAHAIAAELTEEQRAKWLAHRTKRHQHHGAE